LIGIDLDPAASENPCIDEFRMMRPHEAWHVEDASIDLALSDYVLEHVDDPHLFFSDCRRVIRSGGLLCMRTTNVFSYFGLASSSGFDHCVYGCQSEPAHYGFSRMLYALGVLHQRLVPAAIKPAIFAFAVRGD
jgi:2-polyprenyl-3-methyl-5-hydroxy-6-metoxy-1,4-benzoquinol methylase